MKMLESVYVIDGIVFIYIMIIQQFGDERFLVLTVVYNKIPGYP